MSLSITGFFKSLDFNGTSFNVRMNKSKSKAEFLHQPGTVCGGFTSLLITILASSVLIKEILDGQANKGTSQDTDSYSLTDE